MTFDELDDMTIHVTSTVVEPVKPMLSTTRQLLETFYQPYNQQFSESVRNVAFAYNNPVVDQTVFQEETVEKSLGSNVTVNIGDESSTNWIPM